jgi:F-type H+-transporting ATPase subunit delta
MKSQRAVARPYARALWGLARDGHQVEAVSRDLQAVAATLADQPALREFFARPWVPPATKRAVATEVVQRLDVSALVRDLVGLAARHGRAECLGAIAETFRDLMDAEQGRVRARVRTAVPLTPDERRALQQRLGRALGGTMAGARGARIAEVTLEEVVDQRILGGFVAEVDGYIVDGSLDGQLARLRDRLAKE